MGCYYWANMVPFSSQAISLQLLLWSMGHRRQPKSSTHLYVCSFRICISHRDWTALHHAEWNEECYAPQQPLRVEFLMFGCRFWSNETWPEMWVHFSDCRTTLGRKPLIGIFSSEDIRASRFLKVCGKLSTSPWVLVLGFSVGSDWGHVVYIHSGILFSL